MTEINRNYLNLNDTYFFSRISRRTAEYCEKHPDKKVIKMGIGDISLPLCDEVLKALHNATSEFASKETLRGYGPEQGYDFLREKIENYYKQYGVDLDIDEIFVSDGASSDLGNILDIFSRNNKVLIPDPVYPAYVDANTMDGRPIEFLDATAESGFLPLPKDSLEADIVYLCSPDNPTGAVYNREQLKMWVDWALEKKAVILFDAAYEVFICDKNLPHSIYEIPGAKKCAIEICSFSKTAGFTGVRCGYTVVPEELIFDGVSLNKLWLRRQTTKFNGVSYIVQRGAEAVLTPEGHRQALENIMYYHKNADIITATLDEMGIWYTGGKNSPYIWMKCPGGMKSWEYFDYLLNEIAVIGTPGVGFGKNGEGYFRLSAFSDRESTVEAMNRLMKTK